MSVPTLLELGMRPFFQQQLSLEELASSSLGRIVEHHKSDVVLMSNNGTLRFNLPPKLETVCVGDWVVFDHERILRVLERQSLFQRKAAGSTLKRQLIAANIDCVFIVSSLNEDFSLNRIERYLALANEAGAQPVIVLTKTDLCPDPDNIRAQVQKLDPLLSVHSVNALDSQDVAVLGNYCQKGKTIAFLGSSGVGKSTLVNSLLGRHEMETGLIREQDSKGRHTTTHRAIKWLSRGGLLMDTPGMRELQLSDAKEGIQLTFADIESLASQCRFSDCLHENEPGCAVREALESGELSSRRLENYKKLLREEAHNSATLAERRAKDRAFTKMVNSVQDKARSAKKFR
ncbi:TPA: ribosome small subunit-dependent GTPase A [Vibrio parahaemolyticus]|uniref:ribosome small subunit-dependent GTPase A n=1 Tax=Vibrio harveyi group TaxID=717610 RepID=UPI000D530C71|nr:MULTISPECIES: ribosome small subunit-dependent GTPase A [Vibrio harveyi group]AWG79859.1 ribosome small subunit-dependent GTPase A [Vibrio parahaemolyticus]AWJ79487.1 ribosome small subunit-dependent GTPase A [Vibrio parahaemolyticus]EHR5317502.1 ribosome small subunit-dependent GTPase A [Vibrio parahaemolyticus]EHR5462348.1 ribosome small subunit-dependent GTPase A [Vibrio parahaemolyticus]MBD6969515.1 ribosome small subunit-dependent GTPase A [Vibrio parahaemolyticus]